jgi:DNA-binding response OmpR family regulator
LSTKKILLADDSSTLLLVEQMTLGKAGVQLITTKDGEAALRAALAHAPDLILLDTSLPSMDGFEVCRRLRGHDRTRRTPIILLTPRSEPSHAAEGLRSGADATVTRPIDGLELRTKIENLLRP